MKFEEVRPGVFEPKTIIEGYCVKYALSQGIFKVQVRVSAPSDGPYVYTHEKYSRQLKVGKDFFEKKEDAEAAAKLMAKKKVESLKKSLIKMQTLAREPKWMKGKS